MTERRRLDVIEYADWKQGSQFGKGLLPGHGQPSDYQACNMQVYTNGSLGPRPYFTRRTSIVPHTSALTPFPGVTQHDFFYADNGALFLVADGVGRGYSGVGWTSVSGINAYYTGTTRPPPAGSFYVLANNYTITPVSSSLVFFGASMTWNPGSPTTAVGTVTWPGGALPVGVAMWKERSFGFGASAAPNRIYYSDASAPTTFSSASQYFDVGTSGVIGLFPLRDALLIAEENGTWHALTGNSPSTWNRREIGKMRRVNGTTRPVVWRNAVWQLSRNGQGVAVITPEGINETELSWVVPTIDQLIPGSQIVPLKAVGSHETGSLILPFIADNVTSGAPFLPTSAPTSAYTGFQAIELVNGAFTWSKFWSSPTGTGYGLSGTGSDNARILGMQEYENQIWIAVDESLLPLTGNAVAIYARDITLDRPSKTVAATARSSYEELGGVYDADGDSGTNMTSGEVWLRMYAPPPGNRVRVSRIIADVTYWDGSYYEDPTITAQILNENGSLYSTAHTAASHTLTNTSTGDSGVPGRIEWNVGPLPSSEYMQVRFTGIVCVALRKVIVEYEVLPE